MRIIKRVNKCIAIIAIASLSFTSCNNKEEKEQGYTINGELKFEHKIDSIFVYEYSFDRKGKKLSAAPVIDNKFVIKGIIDVPQKVMVGNIAKNFAGELILENADYNIFSDGNSVSVKGGEIHTKVLGFQEKPEYKKLVDNYTKVSEEVFSNLDMSDEEAVEAARNKADESAKKIYDYHNEYLDKIINNKEEKTIVKLLALVSSQNWRVYTKEKRREMFNEYEKEIGKHINIEVEREFMLMDDNQSAMAESVSNGNPFKELVAKDIDGKPIALSELVKNNKFTLLEFWASWCGPCRAEIPNLKEAYKKYKDLGLEIYSVSLDQEREDWMQALKEEKTPWPNSLIVGDEKEQVDAYGVQGIPASYLINSEGVIVASNNELREFDLDKTLSKLIKK